MRNHLDKTMQPVDQSTIFHYTMGQFGKNKASRKESEETPNESKEKCRMIVESAKDAIVMVDNEGKVSYWNTVSEKMFGYSSQQATGKDLGIIIPERYRAKYRDAIEVLREGREHPCVESAFESEAVRQDGTEFPIEICVSTVLRDGRWHAVGIIRDITDRRRAQETLGESLSKYQLMIENQTDAIIMVDMQTRQFIEVNKGAINAYGYSREEFLNMEVTNIFSETTDDLETAMQQKSNIFVHRRKDGSLFPVEITGCVFNWKGRKTFSAIIRDITARGGWMSQNKKTPLTRYRI